VVTDPRSAPAQQSLQLILSRNLISTLSTAAFIVDPDRTVVFYNEAAGDFVGMSYEETGKIPLSELRAALAPVDSEGRPIDAAELPVAIAVREQQPVHETHRVRPAQGEERSVEILALPLIGPDERHEGTIVVFWPHAGGSR